MLFDVDKQTPVSFLPDKGRPETGMAPVELSQVVLREHVPAAEDFHVQRSAALPRGAERRLEP